MIRCRDQKHSKAVYYSVGENYMIIKDSFQFHQPTKTSKHAKLSGPTFSPPTKRTKSSTSQ